MMRQISSINWRYIGDAVPAFVTVMFIPFGYSAAYGLIAGLMVYTALNGMIYLTKLISGGYIVPDDEDNREYWTSKFHHIAHPISPHFPIIKYQPLTQEPSQTRRQTPLVHLRIPEPCRSRAGKRQETKVPGCALHPKHGVGVEVP